MDTRTFLGLEPTHNRFRWKLPVTTGICTGGDFMFGGAGLGAALAAMEGTSGRETIWATAQYLSFARPGEVVDVDVTLAVEGHQMTQARAVCHVADREILTVNAALGHREFPHDGQWEIMPSDVPPPADCPIACTAWTWATPCTGASTSGWPRAATSTTSTARPATAARSCGRASPRCSRASTAPPSPCSATSCRWASARRSAIRGGGNSLDNTLRLAKLVPTDWVLLDIHVHAVERGFGHGLVHMFAEDGTLLATASQSCIVRFWKE